MNEPPDVTSVYSSSDVESESKHGDDSEEVDYSTFIDDCVSFMAYHREQKCLRDSVARSQRRQKQKLWHEAVDSRI